MRAALEASMRRSRAGASTRRDADAVAAEVVKRRQDEEAQPAADAAGWRSFLLFWFCICMPHCIVLCGPPRGRAAVAAGWRESVRLSFV